MTAMAYELRHLRAFVAVAEELHFGRAAARLQLSQPTVSVTIRDFERLLGVRLLDRSTRGVSVAAAGEALLPQAREILAASQRLGRTAVELGEHATGTFVVGLHDEGAAELTAPILEAFHAAQPQLALAVRTLAYATTHRAIEAGEVDVVLSGGSWGDGYEVATLFHDGRGIVVGPRHPAYDATELRFEEVADEPLFTAEGSDPGLERFFDRFLFADHRNGEEHRRAGTASQFSDLLHQINLGYGVNAATASTLRFASFGSVRYIPVTDAVPVPVTAAIPARGTTAAQRVFLRIARETAAELAGRLVPSAVPVPGADLSRP